ncbi:MAG: L-lactate permease [Anaerolineaceae bacterium]|nr:L-lactate permease [Anaerolineaceae bacterium]
MNITIGNFLLALSPILTVLVLMVVFQWGGAKAGASGWLAALFVSLLFFGATPSLLAYSQMRALLLTLYVLYIIWMALILYNIVREAGAIDKIGQGIARITSDRVLQLLILSWVFSSFLQGVAGYGVPIAVVAPLLIGLGFSPVTSVTAATVGHTWAITFGSVGAAFNALIATSGLTGEYLATWSAILLGIVCFLCGIGVTYSFEGKKSVFRGLPARLILGPVMFLTQYWMATHGMWNISAFVAGMAGLGASILVGRLPFYNRKSTDSEPIEQLQVENPAAPKIPLSLAIGAYIILVLIVGIAELYPPAHRVLNAVRIEMFFPQTQTALGWVIQAGKGQAISIFGHAGALLIYTSVITYILFHFTGYLKAGTFEKVIQNTVTGGLKSSIGIATMVGFALIMEQSGMINTLAFGLSRSIQGIFPLVSPFLGVLGTFMTGSNTNSNIVFVSLQKQTAEILKLSVPMILAAQTTGGAVGGMLAPARIIVGCSTAGLSGKEGLVLSRTIPIGLVIAAIVGIITLLAVG